MPPLPAGEIPQNPLRYTGYFSNPVSSTPSQAIGSLGTDWARLIRNCFLGGACLFVVGAGISVLLSGQSTPQPTTAHTPLSASTVEPTVSQVAPARIATTPTRIRQAAVPANIGTQHAIYTVPDPQPSTGRLQPFFQPHQPAPAYGQRFDLRAAQPRSCPNVPLLPDPDF